MNIEPLTKELTLTPYEEELLSHKEQKCPQCKEFLVREVLGITAYLDCIKCKVSYQRQFDRKTGRYIGKWKLGKIRLVS